MPSASSQAVGRQLTPVRALRSGLAMVKRAARQAPNLDTLLELGELYGWLLHANAAGVYADDQLVRLCARRFVSDLGGTVTPQSERSLHLISDTWAYGGHTRLMERLASFEVNRPELLITRSAHSNYAESKQGLFSNVSQVGQGKDLDTVHDLARFCAAFKRVVTHASEFDFRAAVALWAARRAAGTAVFFVNHADHQFSYGREGAHCVLQISRIGINACRQHIPDIRSSFVGIPLDGEAAPLRDPPVDGAFRVLTGGASWKYRPMCGLSLAPQLQQFLMLVPNASVKIVGVQPLRDRWWWSLKLKHWSRVSLTPSLPYADYLRCLAESSIVLDSYPISGGTAFVESLWRGSWVFALTSPLGGGSPTDRLRKDSLATLGPELLTLPAYREELEGCRQLLPVAHGPAAVKERYLAALNGAALDAPDSLQATAHAHFLTEAWLAKGSITLPPPIFGLQSAPCRRILMRYGLRQFAALTWVSRLRWLLWVIKSNLTAARRKPGHP